MPPMLYLFCDRILTNIYLGISTLVVINYFMGLEYNHSCSPKLFYETNKMEVKEEHLTKQIGQVRLYSYFIVLEMGIVSSGCAPIKSQEKLLNNPPDSLASGSS